LPEIGRNDPCPCGSGKKYKRCCLLVREEEERAARVLSGGLGAALDWLFAAHGPAVQAAIERDFFAVADRDAIQKLFARLPKDVRETLEVNLNDWLLADAAIEVDGAPRRTVELLAAAGAPPLAATARERIAEMARRPLALYAADAGEAAGEADADDGFWLRDALDPAAPRVWVKEPRRADRPRPGSLVGARLLEDGGDRILSGALYPFSAGDQEKAQDAVRAAGEGAAGPVILRTWLDLVGAAKAS
jgi:hypothetical protein